MLPRTGQPTRLLFGGDPRQRREMSKPVSNKVSEVAGTIPVQHSILQLTLAAVAIQVKEGTILEAPVPDQQEQALIHPREAIATRKKHQYQLPSHHPQPPRQVEYKKGKTTAA